MHRDGCSALPLPREVVSVKDPEVDTTVVTVIKLVKSKEFTSDCFGVENVGKATRQVLYEPADVVAETSRSSL